AVGERTPAEGAQREGDDGERPKGVREDRKQASGEKGEVVLCRRYPVCRECPVKGAVQRHSERDADGESGVDECGRRRAATSGEEQGAGAEQRSREQRAGRVVDAEGATVP